MTMVLGWATRCDEIKHFAAILMLLEAQHCGQSSTDDELFLSPPAIFISAIAYRTI